MSTAIGALVGVIGTLVIAMQTIILGDIRELRKSYDLIDSRMNTLEVKVAKLER